MSMNFSEFIRKLGADPASQDPAFLSARESSAEFSQAAAESDRFERRLDRALTLPAPEDLLPQLKMIGDRSLTRLHPYFALAAGLLLAIVVAGVTWRLNPGFDSVEQYVAYHYAHDGQDLLARSQGRHADNIDDVLNRFHVALTPEAKRSVSLIKFCPTPNGKGAHMVFNTAHGPVTVIFMPNQTVTDGEMLTFDGMQAQLVVLAGGSAAVIGTGSQQIAGLHSLVQNSFIALDASA